MTHRHQILSPRKISAIFDVEETQLKCVFTFSFLGELSKSLEQH